MKIMEGDVTGWMSGIRNRGFRGLAGAGLAVALCAAAAAPERFETRLSSVAMDILTRDSVAGLGRSTATLNGTTLTVGGTYQTLPSAATGADLRDGVATGARGPVIAKLAVTGGQQGAISGTVKLNKTQLASLRAGRLYVQLSSEKAPDGNLWGWLLPPRTPAGQ